MENCDGGQKGLFKSHHRQLRSLLLANHHHPPSNPLGWIAKSPQYVSTLAGSRRALLHCSGTISQSGLHDGGVP
eukprot:scaffold3226_cov160-Amphora_coffeaeformis.AAC.15